MTADRDDDMTSITIPSGTGIVGPITFIGDGPPMTRELVGFQERVDFDDKGLDDVAIAPVEMFRAERMSKGHWWVAAYLADGSRHTFAFYSKSRITVRHQKEPPL